AGTVITFDAHVTDQGQTPGALSSVNPARVSVRFLPCPTDTTTAAPVTQAPDATTATLDAAKVNNNPWIIIAALLAVLMLSLLSFMIWRYGRLCAHSCKNISCKPCRNWCKKDPPRRPPKRELPPNRPPKRRPESPPPTP
ncbi:hypothetical protein ElyMa_001484000, partial [Elysia marginata]